ncbi:MAG: hypothetical protein ACK5OX_03300 [Desertimonas sp.]
MSTLLLRLQIAVQAFFEPAPDDPARRRLRGEAGQATTEYALVLLAAALVALLVIAWATAGGGAARIARLFNGVIDAVIDKI